MAKRKVTIKEVAQHARVSIGSVSRVLNGLPVSDRLHHKVTEAIAVLGYQPDALARSMRTKSTGVVACLVPNIRNSLYASVVHTIEMRLRSEGLVLMLVSAMNDPDIELRAFDIFRQRHVDGLIVAPSSETDPKLLAALQQVSAPMVVLNRDLPFPCPTVYTDHRGGLRTATRYLLSLGHRRLALLTAGVNIRPGREREAGFREAFEEANVPLEGALVRGQTTSVRYAYDDVQELLSTPKPPTGLIVLGTQNLAGALKAVREKRLRVPEDISIISIGDTDLATVYNPALTAVRWDEDEFGRAAVELLLRQMNGGQGTTTPRQITLPSELVLRDSCGPPPVKAAVSGG